MPRVVHIPIKELCIDTDGIHLSSSEKCMEAVVRSPAAGVIHNPQKKNWVEEEDLCINVEELCMASPE
jgi:hypothetical protein